MREGLVLKWVKSLFRVSPIGARVWFVSCNNGLGHASKNLARLSKWYMSLIRLSTVAFVLLRVGATILGWYSASPALRKLRWLRFYLGPRKVMIQSARPPPHLFQWVTSHSLWRGFNNWFTDWCSVLPAKHATIICCFVQLANFTPQPIVLSSWYNSKCLNNFSTGDIFNLVYFMVFALIHRKRWSLHWILGFCCLLQGRMKC